MAPRRLAESLRARSPWLDVLLLSTAVAVLAAAFLPAEFFLERAENPVTRRGEPVQLTSSPGEIARWGRYLAMLSAAAAHPLVAFSLAGLLVLLFSILGGGRASYGEYLSLTSHALLIPAAGTLLFLAGQALAALPERLSLALFVPGAEGLLREVLAGLDLFHLWALGVLGVGVAVLDGRRSWLRPTLALLGLYLALDVATALLPV